jgi:hypothetical protein
MCLANQISVLKAKRVDVPMPNAAFLKILRAHSEKSKSQHEVPGPKMPNEQQVKSESDHDSLNAKADTSGLNLSKLQIESYDRDEHDQTDDKDRETDDEKDEEDDSKSELKDCRESLDGDKTSEPPQGDIVMPGQHETPKSVGVLKPPQGDTFTPDQDQLSESDEEEELSESREDEVSMSDEEEELSESREDEVSMSDEEESSESGKDEVFMTDEEESLESGKDEVSMTDEEESSESGEDEVPDKKVSSNSDKDDGSK